MKKLVKKVKLNENPFCDFKKKHDVNECLGIITKSKQIPILKHSFTEYVN